MSPFDRVHALWSALQTGGTRATIPFVDDDCEWVLAPQFPQSDPIRGSAAIRAYLERLDRDGVRVERTLYTCEQLTDDVILAHGRVRILSRAALSDTPLFSVYRIREGRIVRIESYACRRDAVTAAAA